MTRSRTLVPLLFLVSAALWAAGQGFATGVSRNAPEVLQTEARAADPPSSPGSVAVFRSPRLVLLVVVDTLRADHAGPLATVRGRTPRLDALARQSLVFAEATSTSSWTLPAMATVFTGLVPPAHGARRMGDAMADRHVTLAELLEDRGYRSFGVVTNGNVAASLGFDQGFERYVMPPSRSMSGYPGEYPFHDARAVTTFTLAELRRFRAVAPEDPIFLYVHYVDPHDPYMERSARAQRPAGRFGGSRKDLAAIDRATDLTEADKERIRGLYRAEVAHLDHWVGRLLDGVSAQVGSLDDMLVVLTSDHGEGLWDHGLRAHGQDLHEEQLRVPLFVKLAGATRQGRVIHDPASLADVAPTILDAVGAEAPAFMQGRSLLSGSHRGARSAAYAELVVESRRLEAVRTPSHKLVCDRSTPRPAGEPCRLFDLVLDPGETTDVHAELAYRGARNDLERRLQELSGGAFAAAPTSLPARPAELDPDTLDNLRALGYVGADGSTR